jgi:hypothetical protein
MWAVFRSLPAIDCRMQRRSAVSASFSWRTAIMIRTTCIAALAALALAACGGETPKVASTTDAAPAPAATTNPGADIAASLGNMAGGKSNPQMTAFATNFDKVVNSVVTIKDEASAKSVGEQLQPIYAEMEAQAKAINALPESEKSAAAMSAAPQFVSGGIKVAQHLMTLSPEVRAMVEKELDKMPNPPEPS